MNKKEFSVFKAFHDAAIHIVDNFAPYAKATLLFISFIVLGGLLIGQINSQFFTQFGMAQAAMMQSSDIAQKQTIATQFIPTFIHNLVPLMASLLAFFLLAAWLWLCYNLFILDMHDKESSSRSFSGARYLITYFFASILFFLMVAFGLICFLIPGIYAILRFGFYTYFIIDKNQGIIESLSSSWRLTSGYEWPMLAFYMIYASIGAIGGPLLFLITFPLAIYAHVCLYRQLTKTETQSQALEQF